MRFGWLVAAAAMVVNARQAQAARYYEFELVGSANRPQVYDPNIRGFTGLNYKETLTFAFDTDFPAVASGIIPTMYTVIGQIDNRYNYSVEFGSLTSTGIAYLDTFGSLFGPTFGFNFALPSVPIGESLQTIAISNNAFTYTTVIDPRSPTRAITELGQIVSFSARTSDVAPANLGITQQLVISVLPEPGTWMMMILGIGVMGASLRQRRIGHRSIAG